MGNRWQHWVLYHHSQSTICLHPVLLLHWNESGDGYQCQTRGLHSEECHSELHAHIHPHHVIFFNNSQTVIHVLGYNSPKEYRLTHICREELSWLAFDRQRAISSGFPVTLEYLATSRLTPWQRWNNPATTTNQHNAHFFKNSISTVVKNSFQAHYKQVCINIPYRHLTMPSYLPRQFAMTKFRLTSAPWLPSSTLSKGWSRHKWITFKQQWQGGYKGSYCVHVHVHVCVCVCVCVHARAHNFMHTSDFERRKTSAASTLAPEGKTAMNRQEMVMMIIITTTTTTTFITINKMGRRREGQKQTRLRTKWGCRGNKKFHTWSKKPMPLFNKLVHFLIIILISYR